jgi:L-ascorbate metabolism protein UlaG (beta-lactamase superfamily)
MVSQLTFVGHATTLIEMDGVRLLTDPILRRRVAHLWHRHGSVEAAAAQNLDAVLISHLHFDHFDLPSLRLLNPSTRLIVPRGAAKWLKGFSRVEEVAVGDTATVGAVTITATYADHARQRHPFGPTADCLGFMIQGRYRLYFAGDTDLFPEMRDLAPNLDVALLPVWGWGPTLGKGHLTPQRAAEALTLLMPRLAVPIHWGSLHPFGLGWFKPRFLSDPPHSFIYYAEQLAPQVRTELVLPGTMLSLSKIL